MRGGRREGGGGRTVEFLLALCSFFEGVVEEVGGYFE